MVVEWKDDGVALNPNYKQIAIHWDRVALRDNNGY